MFPMFQSSELVNHSTNIYNLQTVHRIKRKVTHNQFHVVFAFGILATLHFVEHYTKALQVQSTTLAFKVSWDTSPFFLSVLTYLCDTPSPPINVDCYVLLVAAKFSKCNVYFNIDWGRGGTNDEVRIS